MVWGDSFDGHMAALHQVFKRYSIHNVTVKLSKCHFDCRSTEYVGHIVDVGKGVRTDPAKVRAIVEMGQPRTVQELKSFLGMASYYKRFCKDFAHLAMPLRKIENVYQSKTMDITALWGPLQQRSFVAIKAALAAAPILASQTLPSRSLWWRIAQEWPRRHPLCRKRGGCYTRYSTFHRLSMSMS